jgi:hypothetical protein
MDSGYPTREVVKTASPETLEFAPKAVPWKTGPSFQRVSFAKRGEYSTRERTLMVKVASTPEAGVVARRFLTGMDLPLLPATACWLMKRA